MKNLHSKNLKRKFNIFQLNSSCNSEIPNKQLYLCNISSLQKQSEPFSSIFGKIYQLHTKVLIGKKVCINHWDLMNEQNQPLKVFCKNRYFFKIDCIIKSLNNASEEAQFSESCRPIACNFNKNRTISHTYSNSFNTDLEQLFCSRSSMAASE